MRLQVTFAALMTALVVVTAWVFWDDAFPQWRSYQRELVAREVDRLEAELIVARRELERPEVRYELAALELQLAELAADTTAPATRLSNNYARLNAVRDEIDPLRTALRHAMRRLEDPATAAQQRDIEDKLERVQQDYARATGTWPPDTSRTRWLWAMRDSLADALLDIQGTVHRLRDSLDAKLWEAKQLRLEAIGLTTVRDSLEMVRARLLEPVSVREAALARLRSHQVRVREIVSPDGQEVARCPTCHGSMNEPPGVHPALPAMEVFREVPCTICHQGRGRALTVKDAHQGILAASGAGAGRFSLRARIERLTSRVAAEREQAREELRRITGVDPTLDAKPGHAGDPDSAAAAAWAAWWQGAEPYFEPRDTERRDDDRDPLLAVGIDPWIFSARGRPLRYVGSRSCLRCHEVRHREHVRRWLATKARSLERLAEEPDPSGCLTCHATGYDAATGTYAEPGVTCEGCHGPGERYDEMMTVGQELLDKGDTIRGSALIDFGSRLAREAVSRRTVPGEAGPTNLCVTCHQPRRHRDGGPGSMERQPSSIPAEAPTVTAVKAGE